MKRVRESSHQRNIGKSYYLVEIECHVVARSKDSFECKKRLLIVCDLRQQGCTVYVSQLKPNASGHETRGRITT